ncbi:MAG: stage II sporulation protein M [Oscillospiraceae bacterium]
MIKKDLSLGSGVPLYQKNGRLYFLVLILCFSAGCLAGSLIGSFFGFDSFLNDYAGASVINSQSPVSLFFNYSRFQLVAFLLGTSFLGLALLPVLSCIRGYALSCTAATIISAYPDNGIIMAAIILGIPAIFSLACFFVISIEGFKSSERILHLVRGNSAPRKDKLYARFLACVPFLAIGTLIEIKFVPYLISLLT